MPDPKKMDCDFYKLYFDHLPVSLWHFDFSAIHDDFLAFLNNQAMDRHVDVPEEAVQTIASVADVYDTLRSVRPYKPAWNHEDSLWELSAGAGGQFHPALVERTIADPFAARLVAAALFGIGTESLLSRNALPESFRSMLVTILRYPRFRMFTSYAFMLVFIIFNIVWVYWKLRLARPYEVMF